MARVPSLDMHRPAGGITVPPIYKRELATPSNDGSVSNLSIPVKTKKLTGANNLSANVVPSN